MGWFKSYKLFTNILKSKIYKFTLKTNNLLVNFFTDEGGIIDRVAQDVFLLLAKQKNSATIEATVRVSYMELYKEELRDLLDMNTNYKEILIRDDEKGNTGNKFDFYNGSQRTTKCSLEKKKLQCHSVLVYPVLWHKFNSQIFTRFKIK